MCLYCRIQCINLDVCLFVGKFGMNASTGELYVKTSLDRETQALYTLEVAAYNFDAKAFNETARPVKGRVDGNRIFLT